MKKPGAKISVLVLLILLLIFFAGNLLLKPAPAPKHNKEVHATLSEIIQSANVPAKEAAIIGGLRWLITFVDRDRNFSFIFSDYLALLHELAFYPQNSNIATSAEQLIRNAFSRAPAHFEEIFDDDLVGKWDFISIIRLLHVYGQPLDPYLAFYAAHFPESMLPPYDTSFEEAFRESNYDLLGDYIIDSSFVHYLLDEYPDTPFKLPQDQFQTYLKKLADLNYLHSFESDEDGFFDQNYYATHVAFVLSNYGERPIPASALADKTEQYLLEHFDTVRYKVEDRDLLAEFTHCLKLFGQGTLPAVMEAESFLMRHQHPDGSWGTDDDFDGDPHDVFLPTWTVITALNYPGTQPHK